MPTFDELHSRAWAEHARDAGGVSQRLPELLALAAKPEQVPLLAKLIVHVDGEHLGRWQGALGRLDELEKRSQAFASDEGSGAIARGRLALRLASGDGAALEDVSRSDRIRVASVAAAALVGQGELSRAAKLFSEAAHGAATGLSGQDPAHRDLAVTSNNLALSLEEKPKRTREEDALMLEAAKTARRHWEVAGNWMHVERAEYRLAKSHIAAGLAAEAVRHAENCLEVCAAHEAPAIELFFGQEALALAERARGNLDAFRKAVERAREFFGRLPAEEKPWCQDAMETLAKLV